MESRTLEFIKGNSESDLQEGIVSKEELLASRESKGLSMDLQEMVMEPFTRPLQDSLDFPQEHTGTSKVTMSLQDVTNLLTGTLELWGLFTGLLMGTSKVTMSLQDFINLLTGTLELTDLFTGLLTGTSKVTMSLQDFISLLTGMLELTDLFTVILSSPMGGQCL